MLYHHEIVAKTRRKKEEALESPMILLQRETLPCPLEVVEKPQNYQRSFC